MNKTRIRMLAPLLGVALAGGLMVGCSGGNSDATSTTIATPVEPAPDDDPTTTSNDDEAAADESTDDEPSGQELVATAGMLGVRCEGSMVEVLAYDTATAESTTAYDVMLPDDATVDCSLRSTFDAEFSTLLFTATDPESLQSHIWSIDLGSGEQVDLTEPRQGSGFSAELLDEGAPGFVSDGGSPLEFGSSQIAFQSSGIDGMQVLEIDDPSEIVGTLDSQAFASGITPPPDHQELWVEGWTPYGESLGENEQRLMNPSGTMIAGFADGGMRFAAWPADQAPDGSGTVRVDCAGDLLGWVDDSHLAIWEAGASKDKLFVATVGSNSIECGDDLMPPTDLQVSAPRLTLDRSAIAFTAGGAGGDSQDYVLEFGESEPTPETYPPIDTDTYLYEG